VVHGANDNFRDGFPRQIPAWELSQRKRVSNYSLPLLWAPSLRPKFGNKLHVTGCGTEGADGSNWPVKNIPGTLWPVWLVYRLFLNCIGLYSQVNRTKTSDAIIYFTIFQLISFYFSNIIIITVQQWHNLKPLQKATVVYWVYCWYALFFPLILVNNLRGCSSEVLPAKWSEVKY
jgi:hypothetical protein